jgi:hypothetical protein
MHTRSWALPCLPQPTVLLCVGRCSYIRGKPETGDVDMLILAPASCGDVDSRQLLNDLVHSLTAKARPSPSSHLKSKIPLLRVRSLPRHLWQKGILCCVLQTLLCLDPGSSCVQSLAMNVSRGSLEVSILFQKFHICVSWLGRASCCATAAAWSRWPRAPAARPSWACAAWPPRPACAASTSRCTREGQCSLPICIDPSMCLMTLQCV